MMSVDVVRPVKASTFLEFSPQPLQLDPSKPVDQDGLPACVNQTPVRSATWSPQEMVSLAQRFIERTELLQDVAVTPVWDDGDDIFDEKAFAEAQPQSMTPPRRNLTSSEKREILRELFAHEFSSAEDAKDDPLSYLGLALYYRRLLLTRRLASRTNARS